MAPAGSGAVHGCWWHLLTSLFSLLSHSGAAGLRQGARGAGLAHPSLRKRGEHPRIRHPALLASTGIGDGNGDLSMGNGDSHGGAPGGWGQGCLGTFTGMGMRTSMGMANGDLHGKRHPWGWAWGHPWEWGQDTHGDRSICSEGPPQEHPVGMRTSMGTGTGTPMGLETSTGIGLGPSMGPGTPMGMDMGTPMGLETSGMCLRTSVGMGTGRRR